MKLWGVGTMAENVYFINPAWIESAKQDLDDADMREYYYWLIECRVCGRDLDDCPNKLIKIALRDVLRQADTVQENYENSVKEGKKGGRKPNPNSEMIYKMAKEGKKCRDIAAELNMNEKTVYGNPGWKRAQEELKSPVVADSSFSF